MHPIPAACIAILSLAIAPGGAVSAAAEVRLVSAPDDPMLLGRSGSGRSIACALNGDGSEVLFVSEALQLVPGDRNGVSDGFVHGSQSGTLQRLSLRDPPGENPRGGQVGAASTSGRYVALLSDGEPETGAALDFPQAWRLDRDTGAILLASRRADGMPASDRVYEATISANGRWLVFASGADDLVPGDDNGEVDVFVFDAQTLSMQRASTSAAGAGGDDGSYQAGISNDGRYVGFESGASNLVPGDDNAAGDVFVKDLHTGAIERVSVATNGAQANGLSDFLGISADGDAVLFRSSASNLVAGDSNGASDLFIRWRGAGITERVSVDAAGQQSAGSQDGAMSADAGTVVFLSSDETLDGPTGGLRQLFSRDTGSGAVTRLTSAGSGIMARPALSATGTVACFDSDDDGMTPGDANAERDVYAVNLATGELHRASQAAAPVPMTSGNGAAWDADMAADGSRVVFTSAAILDAEAFDAHGVLPQAQVYLREVDDREVRLASTAEDGTPANRYAERPRISGSGRYLTWQTAASNLSPDDRDSRQDVYRKDLEGGEVLLVSTDGNGIGGGGFDPSISRDGGRIAFTSGEALLPDDTNGDDDVYVWDLIDGLRLASVTSGGAPGNDDSFDAELSSDGRFVVFTSEASDLVPGSSGARELFLRDLVGRTTLRIGDPVAGAADGSIMGRPSISGDGARVAFVSTSSNLVADDPNGNDADVFIADLAAATLERVPVEDMAPGLDYVPESPALSDDGAQLWLWLRGPDHLGNARLLRYAIASGGLESVLDRQGPLIPDLWPQAARPSSDGTMVAIAHPDPLVEDDINGPGTLDVYWLRAPQSGVVVFADGFE